MAPWINYKGVDLFRPAGSTAYTYTTARMEIDADGAPKAYHPDNHSGLDDPANAGFPSHWQGVLVADPANPAKPFVQPDGPAAGFFVSMTALQGSGPATSPQNYVDAARIPYLVFPGGFHALDGTGVMGDFLVAKNLANGRVSAGIVADIGPQDAPLGEVSMAMVTGLGGINPNPRNGAGKPPGPYRYVVFPRSHKTPKWPLTGQQIEQAAQGLLASAGGWPAFDNLS